MKGSATVDTRTSAQWLEAADLHAVRYLRCSAAEAWAKIESGEIPAFCPFAMELDQLLSLADFPRSSSLHEIHDRTRE